MEKQLSKVRLELYVKCAIVSLSTNWSIRGKTTIETINMVSTESGFIQILHKMYNT